MVAGSASSALSGAAVPACGASRAMSAALFPVLERPNACDHSFFLMQEFLNAYKN